MQHQNTSNNIPESTRGQSCDCNHEFESIRVQYLGLIQQNIARMANCSIAIKGLCAAIIVGILALFPNNDGDALLRCLVPIAAAAIGFSIFDGHYLLLERKYRNLYTRNASCPEDTFDRSMNPDAGPDAEDVKRLNVFFSWSVLGFYFVLLVVSALAVLAKSPSALACCF